jgi:hypothetical protein
MTETPQPDDGTQAQGGSSPHDHRPNWGSAYPSPQQPGYPPQQPGYPPPPGYQPYPVAPKHGDATTAMVLGIVSLGGAFICGLPILIAPFAWYMGAKAERDIDASRGTLSGRGEASAGKILGIIGTVLLVLAIVAIVVLIVLSVSVEGFWDDDSDTYQSVLGVLHQALPIS